MTSVIPSQSDKTLPVNGPRHSVSTLFIQVSLSILNSASETLSLYDSASVGCQSHHHAAAGMDILAREPARLVAYHKGHHVGDVLRGSQSFQRRHLRALLAKGIGQHGRFRESRRHGVDGDSLDRKSTRLNSSHQKS